MGVDKTRNTEHFRRCNKNNFHEKIHNNNSSNNNNNNNNNNNKIIFVKTNNNVKKLEQKTEKERNKENETRIISGYEKTIFGRK